MSKFKLKDLFVKSAQPAHSQQTVISTPSIASMPSIVPSVSVEENLLEDYIKAIEDFLETRNQPGFDAWEFIKMLYEATDEPKEAEFKMVYKMVKAIAPEVNSASLLQSIALYRQDIQNIGKEGLDKVAGEIVALQNQKTQKQTSLQGELNSVDGEISALEKKLSEAKARKSGISSALSNIEQEFSVPLFQLSKKQSTIQAATKEVDDSFIEVESGIKNFIK